MDYDEDEDANDDQHDDHKIHAGFQVGDHDENTAFGDDFDDFEEGATADDFGDFDDSFQGRNIEPELESEKLPLPSNKPVPTSESRFVSRVIFNTKINTCSANMFLDRYNLVHSADLNPFLTALT